MKPGAVQAWIMDMGSGVTLALPLSYVSASVSAYYIYVSVYLFCLLCFPSVPLQQGATVNFAVAQQK